MNEDLKLALWEGAKEPLRLLVLSILPVLIAYFAVLDYQWAIIATLVLRMIDSVLHNYAKEQPAKTRNEGVLGEHGLVGF